MLLSSGMDVKRPMRSCDRLESALMKSIGIEGAMWDLPFAV